MTVENFMYFVLGSATFLIVMVTSSVHKEEVVEVDVSTQTTDGDDDDFPGVEIVPEHVEKKKECILL